MKRDSRFSFLGFPTRPAGASDQVVANATTGIGRLKGAELEQAYRQLLLENQVLLESNERLHERIARQERGLEESPAARQLIRTQRDALAERSHKLREVAYAHKRLQRDHAKLIKESRRLSASLARQVEQNSSLSRELKTLRKALAEATEELGLKKKQLAKLTDRYYQLEAKGGPRLNTGTAANGEF